MSRKLNKYEIIRKESNQFYEKFVKFALEQSTAKDFITNYQKVILRHIANRLAEEGYWLADLGIKLSINDEWGIEVEEEALRNW